MGNTIYKKGNACPFSKPIPATQQAPGKGLDPGGNTTYTKVQCPRKAVTLPCTAAPRPGVAVTIPGSRRAPWSEPGSDVRSGACSALLLPFWSCTQGSPWPPLTVSQGCSKVSPLQAPRYSFLPPALLPCVVFQENQPRVSSKPRSRNWVFCYLEQSRAVGIEFTGPRWELKQVSTTVWECKDGASRSAAGTLCLLGDLGPGLRHTDPSFPNHRLSTSSSLPK